METAGNFPVDIICADCGMYLSCEKYLGEFYKFMFYYYSLDTSTKDKRLEVEKIICAKYNLISLDDIKKEKSYKKPYHSFNKKIDGVMKKLFITKVLKLDKLCCRKTLVTVYDPFCYQDSLPWVERV